jgi:hypothetical protein
VRRNDDLETRWRARKEGDRRRCPDAELSSGMDVGKKLKAKLGIKKRLVSERWSGWNEEMVCMRAGGRGLEENGDVGKWMAASLNRTGVWPNVCCRPGDGHRSYVQCCQDVGYRQYVEQHGGPVWTGRMMSAGLSGKTSKGEAEAQVDDEPLSQ